MNKFGFLFLLVIMKLANEISATEKISRQKRCIVIQKQTGGRSDSGQGPDDEDYDYRRPQPKNARPDRLQKAKNGGGWQKGVDLEIFSPELLKNKMSPFMGTFRKLKNNFGK